ncbi:MAG TPA: NAD-dependent epimerase/dehydratase family protein [Ilumatobacteraceae bacterium]|nr:NAD-dependent epimerase/dehydratase family protein [Ilumatobacteraceae bacterium]
MQQHHVVVGSGPVGSGVALALAERGDRVTVVTRSGTGPQHSAITLVAADASSPDSLTNAASGAASIFNCVNPPYHRWPQDWPPIHRALMTAAARTGAVLVMMDNLYAFGPGTTMPMAEASTPNATGPKGSTRRTMAEELLTAHAAGTLRATLARASDFYGPQVKGAALGERVVPRVIDGRSVSLLGSLDVAHSWSYMPDVVRTLVTLATDERAWGSAWHVPNAPAISQREAVQVLAAAAGTDVKVKAVPKAVVQAMGLFVPMMRGLTETWYQFDSPWVTDSQLTERTFGLAATPFADGAAATVEWWKRNRS